MARSRPTLEAAPLFKKKFGYQPVHTTAAPGQVELLGSYAEFNEGLALCVAINQYVQIAAAPRHDGRIELFCTGHPKSDLFWLSDIKNNPVSPWADPIKNVLLELRRHGVLFSGFNAAIHPGISRLPDLGATAALQAATAVMVRNLYPFKLTETGCLNRPPQRDKRGRLPPLSKTERLVLAKMCHRAEGRTAGSSPNLLSYLTTFCGKAFHAVCADCRFQTVEHLPMIGEIVVALCPSGVTDPNAAVEMENRKNCFKSAARTFRTAYLRSVDLSELSAQRMRLSESEYAATYHVIGEIQRVIFAERALQEGDFLQLGQYMCQSHESARDFLQNSCLEIELLVRLAREHPGCIGSRLAGHGFGGATVNLVTWNHYEALLKHLANRYEQQTGRRIAPFICQIVDGVE